MTQNTELQNEELLREFSEPFRSLVQLLPDDPQVGAIFVNVRHNMIQLLETKPVVDENNHSVFEANIEPRHVVDFLPALDTIRDIVIRETNNEDSLVVFVYVRDLTQTDDVSIEMSPFVLENNNGSEYLTSNDMLTLLSTYAPIVAKDMVDGNNIDGN